MQGAALRRNRDLAAARTCQRLLRDAVKLDRWTLIDRYERATGLRGVGTDLLYFTDEHARAFLCDRTKDWLRFWLTSARRHHHDWLGYRRNNKEVSAR